VAARASAFAFALKETVTVPVPVPEAPPVIAIHPRSDAAVQAHDAAVVTVIDPAPAADPNDMEVADSENEQEAGGGVGSTGDLLWQAHTIRSTAAGSAKRWPVRSIAISPDAIATPLPGSAPALE